MNSVALSLPASLAAFFRNFKGEVPFWQLGRLWRRFIAGPNQRNEKTGNTQRLA
jgi:hypothetical protein